MDEQTEEDPMAIEIMSDSLLRAAGVDPITGDMAEVDALIKPAKKNRGIAKVDRSHLRTPRVQATPTTRPALPDNTSAVDRLRGAIDRNEPLANEKQIGLFYILLGELKAHNPGVEATARTWMDGVKATITKRAISDAITRLRGHLAAPAAAPVVTPATVPDATPDATPNQAWAEWRTLAAQLVEFGGHTGARFAVDTEDGASNTLAFWWIVPNEGPYGMRYFLRQVIGGQGPVRVRMSPQAMSSIARKIIAAGPKEAMLRYGREIGACGHCGRTLTNDVSRDAGIGPVCAAKKGW